MTKLHAHPMSTLEFRAALAKPNETHLQERYAKHWISPYVRRALANSEAKYYLWHGITR